MDLSLYKHSAVVPALHNGIELRDYQHLIANLCVDTIRENMAGYKRDGAAFEGTNGVVDMTVGAGKSYVISVIAKYCAEKNRKAMVLTRATELVKQDGDAVLEVGGMASLFCSSVRNSRGTHFNIVVGSDGTVGGVKEVKKCGVTVGYRSTLKERFSAASLNELLQSDDPLYGMHVDGWIPDVLIIDEAHQVNSVDVAECIDAMRGGFDIYKNQGEDGKRRFSQYAVIIAHFKRLKPWMTVIGFTGTPYRGIESIIGPFWKKFIGPSINMHYLVDRGMLTRNTFGTSELAYDYGDFDADAMVSQGDVDYTDKQLEEMYKKAPRHLTDEIMREVIVKTQDRLGVLITCASKKHCADASYEVDLHYARQLRKRLVDAGADGGFDLEQLSSEKLKAMCVSAGVSVAGGWCVITNDTKGRGDLLEKAKTGEIKYVFQIGCLTTGVDVPYWDTSVILRRIMSLTLLVQLLGRGMRLLKQWQIDAGMVKTDHLILDYSGTMEVMQRMFDDPVLEECALEQAKKKKSGAPIKCPVCATENSPTARRCIGRDAHGEQCEHFWSYKECPAKGCGAKNSHGVHQCRKCGGDMLNINEKLHRTHYKEGDEIPVVDMKVGMTRNGGIWLNIYYDDTLEDGSQRVAKLYFTPFSERNPAGAKRIFYNEFVKKFVADAKVRTAMYKAHDVTQILAHQASIMTPIAATHRVTPGGKHIVARMVF